MNTKILEIVAEMFAIETDNFVLEADNDEGVNDKWWKMAENILDEDPLQKEAVLLKFQRAVEDDPVLQSQNSFPLTDRGFLIRFLRAGKWKVEPALEVLRSYSSLGKDYALYVSKAIPSR